MIPFWRPLLSTTAAIALAFPVDRHLRLLSPRSFTRWPLLALATFAGVYLVFAVPTVAMLAAVSLVGLGLGQHRAPPANLGPYRLRPVPP